MRSMVLLPTMMSNPIEQILCLLSAQRKRVYRNSSGLFFKQWHPAVQFVLADWTLDIAWRAVWWWASSVAALTVAAWSWTRNIILPNRGPERAQLDRDIDRLRPASRRHGAGANHQRQLSQSACADNRSVRSGRSRGYLRSSD